MPSQRTCYLAWLLAMILGPSVRTVAEDPLRHFEQEIRPILSSKCIQCHGAEKQEGGLRLDSRAGLLAGGDSGPAVDLDAPQQSLLLEALRYESYEMPPAGPLPGGVIHQFEAWLDQGALWPASVEHLRPDEGLISDVDRQWWAFQPVRLWDPPQVESDGWSHNAIDRFVRAKLEQHDLRPAPRAEERTLLRRVFYDLVGMPPSPEEVDAYFSDDPSSRWPALIDRLLDDPRYGEHWARYWLDLVRYSESDGWNQDAYRPHIWRYRDYVINAFNDDKPYPQFVLEQLAGDELQADDPEDLIAAGFLRLGIYEYNQRDAAGHWNDIMNEMTDVTGDVFLGLSMACARCHNHKFDPIPQQDYFKLRAFFEPVIWRDDLVAATTQQAQEHAVALSRWEQATADIRRDIDALIEPYHARKWKSTVEKFPLDIQACFHMAPEQRTSWQEQMAYLVSRQFEEEGGGPLRSMSKEDKARHEELLAELKKFDHLKPDPLPPVMSVAGYAGIRAPTLIPDAPERRPIEAGFLTVMQPAADPAKLSRGQRQPTATSRFISTHAATAPPSAAPGSRMELAQWIGDPRNPLTTRVIVNRVWQQHFGVGLVKTSNDFGTQGAQPSHPQLLDWLTHQFVDDEWSFKKLHKRILMSATWQQSAVHPLAERQQAIDPEEKYLWRFRVRRLKAEQIRDSLLAASGELKLKLGGPSVDEQTPRRAVYLKSFRNKNDTFLHGFDVANGLKSVAVRDNTTTPLQALLLINGDYALARATAMARRVQADYDDPLAAVDRCFQLAWNRPPTPAELEQALLFVGAAVGEDAAPVAEERLSDLCHVLFNSNQFLFLE